MQLKLHYSIGTGTGIKSTFFIVEKKNRSEERSTFLTRSNMVFTVPIMLFFMNYRYQIRLWDLEILLISYRYCTDLGKSFISNISFFKEILIKNVECRVINILFPSGTSYKKKKKL